MLSTRVLSGYSYASSISFESKRRLPRRTKREGVFRFACKAVYSLSGSLQRCDQKLANRAFSLTPRCGSSEKWIRSVSVTSEFTCKDMGPGWPALVAKATSPMVLWVYLQCKLHFKRFLLQGQKTLATSDHQVAPLLGLLTQNFFPHRPAKCLPSSTRTFPHCNCRWTTLPSRLLQKKLVSFRFHRETRKPWRSFYR